MIRKSTNRFFSVIVLVVLIVNSSFLSIAQDSISTKVDALLQKYVKPYAPGLSIGIVHNQQLIYRKSVGFSNLEKGILITDSSLFSVASIAKQFTSACIWSLIKEKKISLDDDIRTYLPELPDYGNKILIRHLLNHTSGIRNYHAIMELSGFDYDNEFHDNQTIFDIACRQKELNNIPGEKVIYGNTGYTLLALIIERISGKNLNEYATEKLFATLGMKHTFYSLQNHETNSTSCIGYYNENDMYKRLIYNQQSYGAGSVRSTIADLFLWSDVLNGLNSDFLDLTQFLTTAEKLSSGEKANYARGVILSEYKNQKIVYHSGYSSGSQSQIIVLPEMNLAIIVLTNLESIPAPSLSYSILDLFLPTDEIEQTKQTVTLNI